MSSEQNTQNMNEPKLNLKEYLVHLFDIYSSTDRRGTVQSIKEGISIKGHTAWILVFSILVASIGLNVSSTAVVIGAMLISPLMGPILGLGFSLATNDIETLKRSLVNLGTMVGISLLTSFLFFSVPLFQDETPELLARTKPDLRDVLIAISGGLALIVSISRRTDMTNAIAGVAIATALMPPLCTAGFGLAIGNFTYFGGALFLFIINSIFIALATYVIVKSLQFPVFRHEDSASQKKYIRIAMILATLVLAYSVFTFYKLVKEKDFTQKAENFYKYIKEEGYNVIDKDASDINYKERSIHVTLFGKNLSEQELNVWNTKLNELGLVNTTLHVQQNQEDSKLIQDINELKHSYSEQLKLINVKDESIADKTETIHQLQELLKNTTFPVEQIGDEAKVNYSELQALSFAKKIKYDYKKLDTITVISTQWNKGKKANQQFELFQKWLKTRLETDKIEIIRE